LFVACDAPLRLFCFIDMDELPEDASPTHTEYDDDASSSSAAAAAVAAVSTTAEPSTTAAQDASTTSDDTATTSTTDNATTATDGGEENEEEVGVSRVRTDYSSGSEELNGNGVVVSGR
jgi:hypothetical protein